MKKTTAVEDGQILTHNMKGCPGVTSLRCPSIPGHFFLLKIATCNCLEPGIAFGTAAK